MIPHDVSIKPRGPVLGAYSKALESGALTGAGANTPIFSCRYTGTGLAVIERVSLFWATTTAFTAAQLLDHALFVARSFSAADTGGNAGSFSATNGAHRSNFGVTPGMTDMRISSTAALTAGTRTLDADPIAVCAYWASGVGANNTTSGPQDGINLYKADASKHPLLLGANEGLVLNNVTAMGAAGVIKAVVNISWREVSEYLI